MFAYICLPSKCSHCFHWVRSSKLFKKGSNFKNCSGRSSRQKLIRRKDSPVTIYPQSTYISVCRIKVTEAYKLMQWLIEWSFDFGRCSFFLKNPNLPLLSQNLKGPSTSKPICFQVWYLDGWISHNGQFLELKVFALWFSESIEILPGRTTQEHYF